MGCDVCKTNHSELFALCETWSRGNKRRTAPCGFGEVGGGEKTTRQEWRGTNMTPPKKKHRKRR